MSPSLLFSSNDSLMVYSHPFLALVWEEGAILAKCLYSFGSDYNLNMAISATNEILGSETIPNLLAAQWSWRAYTMVC